MAASEATAPKAITLQARRVSGDVKRTKPFACCALPA